MQCFYLVNGDFKPAVDPFVAESVLPESSILLQRTPFTYLHVPWAEFWQACYNLANGIAPIQWVFVDACWDPFAMSNEDIVKHRQQLGEIFPQSRIVILSARAQHWSDNVPGCVYFPLFLMFNYPDLVDRPRRGRIGCLNRRNAGHRVWMMHHLLSQHLIDAQRDVYSVKFTSVYSDDYWDLDGTLHIDWFNQAQRQWPRSIETHPDNFPNDYSIAHPAWHTGIAIITETEPGVNTIVCEKTAKGILSQSCFSIYMAESGYQVLENLGFRPRFFDTHAEHWNIDPVIDICKNITTESQAMEYRMMHIKDIEHNFDWFAFRQGSFQSRPWWQCYGPKLQHALNSL